MSMTLMVSPFRMFSFLKDLAFHTSPRMITSPRGRISVPAFPEDPRMPG